MKSKGARPNRLINEKSPYLLQHAHNPVDWYPWGDEAFRIAKDQNKPIFLSIGYASCHWCHVMEEESFEDPELARLLNENFVSIKVDREERPDVDEVYMKAVQAMTGQGGWPLTAFLTQDLKPFFGGTYFPPESRHGLPSFKQVLLFVARAWREKRGELEATGQDVMRALKELYSFAPSKDTLDSSVLDSCFDSLVMQFDETSGGFGSAPKFPMPSYIFFLLRYRKWKGKELALKMAHKTLLSMAKGGIRDQIGGGFHRYSTDRIWLVPHFEKMLYDNALLTKAYLEGFQATHDTLLSDVAKDTLAWVLREMKAELGGFYSAIDADSEGREGAFYVWTRSEVYDALGENDGELACKYFGVTEDGNFEHGDNILRTAKDQSTLAKELGAAEPQLQAQLSSLKMKLLARRNTRPKPLIDDKILTSWNGLMISALAYAYQALGDPIYADAAQGAAKFVLEELQRNGRLLRRYRDGEAAISGTLEDYAYFVMGLIDLYEATFNEDWLKEATRLTKESIELFWDDQRSGFFFNSEDQAKLSIRIKDGYDGATPSPNSVHALNLLKIAELLADEQLKNRAEKTILAFWRSIESHPTAHTQMLTAVQFVIAGPMQVVIAGDPASPETQAVIRELHSHHLPNKVVALSRVDGASSMIPFLQDKVMRDGKPTVYICENYTCKAPIVGVQTLRDAMS